MRRWVIILILVMLKPAWCVPASSEAAAVKELVPKGYTLLDVLHLGGDRVAIFSNRNYGRVCVLHGGRPLWVLTSAGSPTLPAHVGPSSGNAHETMRDLVYSVDLDHNRRPYLFVNTYMADSYTLLVCKLTSRGYVEVFRTGSMSQPKLDRKTGRLDVHRLSDSDANARSTIFYVWKNHTFVDGRSGFSGAYMFSEHADPNQNWLYILRIGKPSTLVMDGFQSVLRYDVETRISGNIARVFFVSSAADNSAQTYKPSTLLFTLERKWDGNLITRWAAMHPQVPADRIRTKAFSRD